MRALLSVSDKTGLVDLALHLTQMGVELVSTGGTCRAIHRAGLEVTPVSEVTMFPEMLADRVKTLHPAIHGGILAIRSDPEHMAQLAKHGIKPIDIVVVNLYPFKETAMKVESTCDEIIEKIDIGGPSMVRSAAKNFRDVVVVAAPADYPELLEQLRRSDGPTLEFRLRMAQKAFAHTRDFDAAVSSALLGFRANPEGDLERATSAGVY